MKKNILLCFLFVFSLAFFSCHTHKKYYRSKGSYKNTRFSSSGSSGWSEKNSASGGFEYVSGVQVKTGGVSANSGDQGNFMDGKTEDSLDKKIIYDASADLKIKKVDSANAQLKRIAEKYEGYAQSLGQRTSVIRIKSANLNAALADIAKIGKMRNKSVYGEDVTEQYFDLALRLDNYERTRLRYNELLAKAVGVNEILKVEKELERVTREIELLKGKLTFLQSQIDYSTITVYLNERKKLGILGYVFKGLYLGVRWLFVLN
ncbi:MAG: DUF4349 domain-containing protein [Bacteroidota bacterium]